MGDTSKTEPEVGFDQSQTRDILVGWLREQGVDAALYEPSQASDPSLSEEAREELLWREAHGACLIHMSGHGIPAEMRENGGGWKQMERCPAKPCIDCGVVCSLYELCHEWRARHQADFSVCVDSIAAQLAKLDASELVVLERAASKLIEEIDELRRDYLKRIEENEAIGRLELAAQLRQGMAWTDQQFLVPRRRKLVLARRAAKALRHASAAFAELRDCEEVHGTPHRPLPSERTAGRPKSSLLTAVLQHLKRENVEYGVMQKLVAGMGGGGASASPKAITGQIRSKLRNDDCRSIRPSDD